MIEVRGTLRVLLDEGVPRSVGAIFLDHGHEVLYLEQVLKKGSKDEVVCIAAEANNAVLVAMDKDMKQIARRNGISASRFKRLSLIHFACPEPRAAGRIEAAMPLIEFEWGISSQKVARRLFVQVGTNHIKTNR
ncbi:MAG: DUF5615 family PIN-like protein [Pseudomonadota bacterium]|nr:DUF5615 family PIN-like protein [Pseudomonadota bacterium]